MLKLLVLALTTSLVLSCDFQAADRCMQQLLLLGDPTFQFPTDNNKIDTHCGNISAKEKCVKDYATKCLDPFSLQVTTNLMTGAVKTLRGYCTTPVRRQSFIKLSECANPRKEAQDQLMVSFIDTVQAINTFEDKKMRIPLLCCNFRQFKRSLLATAANDVQPKCSEQVTQEIDKIIDGFSSDVLNLVCPLEYSIETGEKCDTILGLTPALKSSETRPKSMLMPLVKIFDSLRS